MTNQEKYRQIFKEALQVEENELESLTYQEIDSWDSIGHMRLIGEIEETFEIMLDTNEIIDFSSFKKGKEILRNYDIEL